MNSNIKFLFLLFLSFLLPISKSIAQFDTLFWFAAPEVAQADRNFDRPIYIWLSSSNTPSQVTITQPANSSFAPIVVNLAANTTQYVDLTPWIEQIETKPPNQALNYGIKVSANNPINAYYEILSLQCMCSPEIFVFKGKNSLGTQFLIPMQNYLNNANDPSYLPIPYSSFVIVATENNTNVTITPTANVVGHTAGIPYTINLNQGQTYSATATSQSAAQHLSGSIVSSDKPIAITINDDLMYGGTYGTCADDAGDQIIPINRVGKKYIVVRGFLTTPYDKVFILATQNNTSIQVNGTTLTTINSGQTYMYSMNTADAVYIETSNPVYALQLSGFGCEIGNCLVPQIECTGSNSVTFTRSTEDPLHLMLIVPAGAEGNFQINGNSTLINASQFLSVPGTANTWKFAKITYTTSQIPAGVSTTVTNSSDKFHLGIIHGTPNNGCRFGFFSDFGQYKLEIIANGDHFCVGDTLQLSTSTINSAIYSWSGPDGFSSNLQNIQLNTLNYNNEGLYIVNGDLGGCVVEPDSIYIYIYPSPSVEIDPAFSEICIGESITLEASGAINYIWSNLETTQTIDVSPTTGISYFVVGMDENNCKDTAMAQIEVKPLPELTISPNPATIFDGDMITLTVFSDLPNTQFLWSNGSVSNNITVSPSTSTDYQVTGISNGCSSTAAVTVHVKLAPLQECSIYMPNSFSPDNDGLNDILIPKMFNAEVISFVIINRWGQKVFESNRSDYGWDGTFLGQLAPSDTYAYRIRYIQANTGELKHIFGAVSLIR